MKNLIWKWSGSFDLLVHGLYIWYSKPMTRRVQKVAELLRQQLAEMIIGVIPEELGLITVTEVIVSADIKNATVYISCLEKTSQKEVLNKLKEKTPEFQHTLGKLLAMRYIPKLSFKVDRGLEQINRVEEILEKVKKDK